MKRIIKRIAAMAVLAFFAVDGFAQQNIDQVLRDPSNNYFVIKQKADAYFQARGIVGTGYKEFKRWEFLNKPNMAPDGTLPDFVKNNQLALDNFKLNNPQPTGTLGGIANWTPMGQQNPTIQAGDGQNGVGSVRGIEMSGSNIWVGTAGGGIWYGIFGGGSTYNWTPKTDGTPNLAVQEVRIAPTSGTTMYALTGAVGSASGYRSTGVIKSTDGGLTWNSTGLTFPESGNVKGYRLLVSSTSSQVVWACTDNGLYRTADGGTTWNLVTYSTTIGGAQTNFSANAYDIVYQPGSTTNMYATSSGPYFYKSTDGGLTFLRIDRVTAGLPTTGDRTQIGVTAANSAYVYLLYGDGTGYQATYLSINSGSNFTLKSTTPNILGGQSWRNICIAVSPTNAADVYVGGLDVYKSTTSGATWTAVSNSGSTTVGAFSHADIFDLYCDATYLYCASDGGIYRMTRSTDTWVNLHNNMQIAQTYRLGADPTASAAFVTMGNQDNGTYRNSGVQYLSIGGADGMESIITPSNTNVIYLSTQSGNFYRSDDGGTTNIFIRGGAGNWTTPAVLRPGNDTHIYIGYINIDYNTTSGNGAWSTITTGFGSAIESLEFAPNNSTILYATDGSAVKRFNLSGGIWTPTAINGNLPALGSITELAVDPDNSSHVVISVGGYTATQKVYETLNANNASPTWNPIQRNLPNVPVNCIVMNSDANNSIYIGTDIGVFVTTDSRPVWMMYNNGLPTTRVYDLEINTAAATDKIFAATFGRGVFVADTYTGCTASASLSGSITGLQYTEVSSTITSSQYVWGGDGTSIGYNAGGSITLNPGFTVSAPSTFNAYIQGCAGTPVPLRAIPGKLPPVPEKLLNENAEGDVPAKHVSPAARTNQQSENKKPENPEGDAPKTIRSAGKTNIPSATPQKPIRPEGDN